MSFEDIIHVTAKGRKVEITDQHDKSYSIPDGAPYLDPGTENIILVPSSKKLSIKLAWSLAFVKLSTVPKSGTKQQRPL